MKIFYLSVFVFLLSVDAQRRSVNSELLSENEPPPKSARRGRARFTATSDLPQVEEPRRHEPVGRRLVSRRRPESHPEPVPVRRGYEVDEAVDEPPVDPFRKYGKTKVLTETKFEARNAPPSNSLFQPSTTESIDDIIRTIGSNILDSTSSSVAASSTVATSLEPQFPELTSSEYTKLENEISRTQPVTTPSTTRTTSRSNGRSRSSGAANNAPTVAARGRARTRATRRPEEQNPSAAPRAVHRGARRRPESANVEARTRGPSSAETVAYPVRSRSGEARSRAVAVESARTRASSAPAAAEPTRTRAQFVNPPADAPRSRASITESARTRGPSVLASAESVELPSRSRSGRRIGTAARRVEEPISAERLTLDVAASRRSSGRVAEATTTRSRSRARSRDVPPIIDEQKLEVLPLFERESKTVRPVRKFVSRRRNLNSAEEVETSATENDVKVAPKPPQQSVVVETRTEASVKRRKTVKVVGRVTKPTVRTTSAATKSTVKTTTKPTTKSTVKTTTKPAKTTVKTTVKPSTTSTKTTKPTKPTTKATVASTKPTFSKPVIRESVVSEITEVTSKRTVRSKARSKPEAPKFVPRGTKKSEVVPSAAKKNKSSLTSSEEEIEDSDNYPEPFKALIQAKKQKKESRPPQRQVTASPAVTKSTEKVANSSPSTTTPVTSSEANRQLEDSENELDPTKASRTTRRRFGGEKGTRPTRKSKFARSTTVVPEVPEHRFHAKFNDEPEAASASPVKSGRGFSPKPSRVYSSRKTKDGPAKGTTAQIPVKKSNRYSSRYRNDAAARGAIRTSTNAPAYLPTIPTITPPTTSVKSAVAYQDKDLGVEVISFDDPVNTVPSANLVSGEYLASSTENHLTSPLVSASQTKTTEKPVSIIERIINSITAISTTEVPDVTRQTTPSHDAQTKESAILKLATKKSTRLDKTLTTQKIPTVTVTSEKPTTIIERILTSLSAIQADNTTDTKHFKSKQVEQDAVPPFEANPLSLSSVNNATSTTPSSTVPAAQPNPLSISSSSSTSTSTVSSSSSSAPTSTTPGTTTSSTAPTATLPTLSEILNGRTVQAFNSIINISDLSKVQTLDVDPKRKATTTTMPAPTLSNRILDDPPTTFAAPTTQRLTTTTTTVPPTTTFRTTTNAPTTTTPFPTTTIPPTTATFAYSRATTVLPLSQPATTTYRTTTSFPSSTTFFPQFLTTLFSTLRPRRVSTEAPIEIVTPISNRVRPSTTPRFEISTGGDLFTASSTRRTVRTTTEPPTTLFLSTLPISTTVRSRRRGTTTRPTTTQATTTIFTTPEPTTTTRGAKRSTSSPDATTANATKKLRKLTEQQKKDLETLAQLEMEQAAILKQLAFLTNLNFANTQTTTDKNELANRIVALAVEQDKERQRTSTAYMQEKRQGKKISASGEHTVEQLVRQLSVATPSTITTEYGNSNDAIIAALLKEQGIGPTTPKVLEDVYSLTTTTTRKPKTTTRRPGPLMQSLNWLLNVLSPPTTTKRPRPKSKPKSKPKPKPKPKPVEHPEEHSEEHHEEHPEELLTHQPTHITPVVTPAPRQNIVSSLSQNDIQKLIRQLEVIQRDPQGSRGLDFSSIQSLQSLINTEGGVKVTSSGTTGTTPRETTPMTTSKRKSKSRVVKSTTVVPLSVSNSIADDEVVATTTRPKVTLAPVRLRPVPGIEDDDTMVRGQLINAAVNVTRAISSFLGTALQDAARQFTRMFADGSSNLRNSLGSSSALANLTHTLAAS